MITTRHIQPPETGPRSDPLLFGVAEALSCIFPLDERHFLHPCAARISQSTVTGPEPASVAAPAVDAGCVTV